MKRSYAETSLSKEDAEEPVNKQPKLDESTIPSNNSSLQSSSSLSLEIQCETSQSSQTSKTVQPDPHAAQRIDSGNLSNFDVTPETSRDGLTTSTDEKTTYKKPSNPSYRVEQEYFDLLRRIVHYDDTSKLELIRTSKQGLVTFTSSSGFRLYPDLVQTLQDGKIQVGQDDVYHNLTLRANTTSWGVSSFCTVEVWRANPIAKIQRDAYLCFELRNVVYHVELTAHHLALTTTATSNLEEATKRTTKQCCVCEEETTRRLKCPDELYEKVYCKSCLSDAMVNSDPYEYARITQGARMLVLQDGI